MSVPASIAAAPRPSPGRALACLAWGALLGSALTALAFTTALLATYGPWTDLATFSGAAAASSFTALVVGLPIWFVGLTILGAPSWWLWSRVGVRSRRAAAAWGGLLTFLAVLGWSGWRWSPDGVLDSAKEALPAAAVLGAIGAVVGGFVARLAYGRPGAVR